MQISRYEAEKPLLLIYLSYFAKNLHQTTFETFERHRQIRISSKIPFQTKKGKKKKYLFPHIYTHVIFQWKFYVYERFPFETMFPISNSSFTPPCLIAWYKQKTYATQEFLCLHGTIRGYTSSIDFSLGSPWNIWRCQVLLTKRCARPNLDEVLKIPRTGSLIAFNASWRASSRSSHLEVKFDTLCVFPQELLFSCQYETTALTWLFIFLNCQINGRKYAEHYHVLVVMSDN